jgi:hypothetical protein
MIFGVLRGSLLGGPAAVEAAADSGGDEKKKQNVS